MFAGGVPFAALAGGPPPKLLLDIDLTAGDGGLTCTRSTSGTMFDASGKIVGFAANTLRRINGVGLLVEPAATNYVPAGTLSASPWSAQLATSVTSIAGPADTSPATTAQRFLINATAGNPGTKTGSLAVAIPAATKLYYAVMGRYAGIRFLRSAYSDSAANKQKMFDLQNGVAATYSAGSPTDISVRALAGGFYLLTFGFTSGASSTGATLGLYGSTSDANATMTGDGSTTALDLYGASLSTFKGSYFSGGTRAADAVPLPIAGIRRTLLTFDDGSTQAIGGIDPSTPFVLPAANLNRNLLTRIRGWAA